MRKQTTDLLPTDSRIDNGWTCSLDSLLDLVDNFGDCITFFYLCSSNNVRSYAALNQVSKISISALGGIWRQAESWVEEKFSVVKSSNTHCYNIHAPWWKFSLARPQITSLSVGEKPNGRRWLWYLELLFCWIWSNEGYPGKDMFCCRGASLWRRMQSMLFQSSRSLGPYYKPAWFGIFAKGVAGGFLLVVYKVKIFALLAAFATMWNMSFFSFKK